MTPKAMLESVNGFEDLDVKRKFGNKILRVSELEDDVTLGRALVFVHQRRAPLDINAAYEAAMTLTIGQLQDYFADPDPIDGEDEGPKEKPSSGQPSVS